MTMETTKKKAVLFCTCSGACPSMAKIDFWALAERVRILFYISFDMSLISGNGIQFR